MAASDRPATLVSSPSRTWPLGPRPLGVAVAALTMAAVLVAGLVMNLNDPLAQQIRAKGYRKSATESRVIGAQPAGGAVAGAPAPGGWTTQVRLGHSSGDGWEPAIAADRSGHVYLLYAQYLGVPGCPGCQSPTQIVQVSDDRGATWRAPQVIQTNLEQGWDSQIVVDPADGKTVYAAWIERYKSDVMVARSTDFGRTWTVVMANRINKGADKPILAVRGQDVYVAYNHATQMYVASSHDGGRTFSELKINPDGKLGWALASGGTVTPDGAVHFGWAGYEQNGKATGPVNLFISTSRDGGATWGHQVVDTSAAPPNCSDDFCGWNFLGAQVALASDANGLLYALWNAGTVENGPEDIWFARSLDGGASWSTKVDVSLARAGAHHSFPAIIARGSGDVRISWMDSRVRSDDTIWNTYYRSSTRAGSSWSSEKDVSTFVSGVSYIVPDGYEFPFGDYFELDIDDRGTTQLVNGQGLNYDTPGHVWYARGT